MKTNMQNISLDQIPVMNYTGYIVAGKLCDQVINETVSSYL